MKIKCAAIRSKAGIIVEGRSHADAYQAAYPDGNFKRAESGFVTDTGEFVDRKEAGRIAFEAGQIDKPTDCLFSILQGTGRGRMTAKLKNLKNHDF